MKKSFLITFLLFAFLSIIVAQDATISIPAVEGTANSQVLVPVNITTLNSVGAITLNIKYDKNVMSFTEVVENNAISGGFFSAGTKGDSIATISWFSSSAVNLDGKMFDLKFDYVGGTSDLEFDFVEITNTRSVPYNVASTNGSISEASAPPAKIELNDVTAIPGDTITVDLYGADLTGVGSMNLYIEYDTTRAEYIGLGDTNLPGFVDNASNGVVSLGMFNATGFNHTSGNIATLKFLAIAGRNNLVFASNSKVEDTAFNNIPVQYSDGSITVSESEMLLGDVSSRANQNIMIPFSGRNMFNIGSFNLDIDFDENSLTFVGVHDSTSGGIFTSNVVNGVLKLAYFNTSGLTLEDGIIANLEFTYTNGNSNLVFDRNTATVQTTDFVDVTVLFTDGSIAEQANQLPIFVNALSDTTISEAQELTFLYTGTDGDGDALAFALVSGPTGATLDADGNFAWTPTYDQAGVHEVVVSLSDGLDMVYDTANVTVTGTNRDPYFTSTLPDTTIAEMEELTYLYTGFDPDGDALTFSLTAGPDGATLDADGNFAWTPTYDQAGVYDAVIAGLSDGQVVVYDTTTITVTDNNRAPYFTTTMPDTTVTEGIELSYQYAGDDPDGNALTFEIFSAPDGATISTDGLFAWTPATPDDIVATIIISLTDQVETVYDTTEVSVLTDVEGILSTIPNEFSLGQNYPNPFNPSTTIQYDLPENAMVNLTIYDVTGQKVATLLDSEITAGYHKISFDASKLAGGVYLYRIVALGNTGTNFSVTKKMLLIK